MDLNALKAPFPPDQISWRVGPKHDNKTIPLAYIDSRDVQERLDAVCGPGGWQTRHHDCGGGKLACEVGILIKHTVKARASGIDGVIEQTVGEGWIWKSDGAGSSDIEAEKGAFSDSFKRAAVQWGVGRYLYDVKAPWVKLTENGKGIDPAEMSRLKALLGGVKVAKPPLDGEHKNITSLKTAARAFSMDLQAVEDYDALVQLLNSTVALQEQMRVDWPEAWEKADAAIELRKENLAKQSDQQNILGAG